MVQPDEFNESVLNGIWTVVNPKNDATYSVGDGMLSINVPGGTAHDAWYPNDAPRIMQNVSNTDFEIELKFQSQLSLGYQMQGIIIEQDSNNFLRFDFLNNLTNNIMIYSASITNSIPLKQYGVIIGNSPSIIPIYMRIKRTGDQWLQSYSIDQLTWINGANYDFNLNVTKIGIFAGNFPDITAPAFTCLVDYINPICPQPSCSLTSL